MILCTKYDIFVSIRFFIVNKLIFNLLLYLANTTFSCRYSDIETTTIWRRSGFKKYVKNVLLSVCIQVLMVFHKLWSNISRCFLTLFEYYYAVAQKKKIYVYERDVCMRQPNIILLLIRHQNETRRARPCCNCSFPVSASSKRSSSIIRDELRWAFVWIAFIRDAGNFSRLIRDAFAKFMTQYAKRGVALSNVLSRSRATE